MRTLGTLIGNVLLIAATVPLFVLCLIFAIVAEMLPNPVSRIR